MEIQALLGVWLWAFLTIQLKNLLEDCFISLLHWDVIDADKLDYICRDKWASGYLADSVDLDRLIDSIVLHKGIEGRYKIAYSKSSINEIQALIDSKNFQTNWVFLHHQVVYEQKLLKDSVTELVKCLQNDGQLHPPSRFYLQSILWKATNLWQPRKRVYRNLYASRWWYCLFDESTS